MKRKSIAIVTILLFTFVLKGNDLKRSILKGNVKSVTETNYDVVTKFGEVQSTNLSTKYIYKYDVIGNLSEGYCYSPEGNLTVKYAYKHDDKGNMIECVQSDIRDILKWKAVYKDYNDKGYTEGDLYNADSLVSKYVYTYDGQGNQVEWNKYEPDGSLSNRYDFTYDIHGNRIEEKVYKSDGAIDELSTYKYEEYDAKGNWQKQTELRSGVIYSIVERKIEYYYF